MDKEFIKNPLITIDRIIILIAGLLIITTLFSIYFFRESRINPQEEAKNELTQVLKMVGQSIILPNDEIPTLATVTDLEKLKSQPFFANAKVGDKVLIYKVSKKAILFDPASNKIIEVAPINTAVIQ